MQKRIGGVLIALLIASGLVAVVLAESGIVWVGAEEAVNISDSQDVLDETALAVGPGRVAALWAGESAPKGPFLVEKQTGDWTSVPFAPTGGQASWYPAVAYSGTQIIAAWAQGEARYPRYQPRAVMQWDQGDVAAKTVITPVFGDINLDLAVGSADMHMVFVATSDSDKETQGHLYYTHRSLTQADWSSPTVVVTNAQVVDDNWQSGMTAGIWWARVGWDDDDQTVHIVWEQEHKHVSSVTVVTRTIWYMPGIQQSGGGMVWSEPVQISPSDQQYAIRPSLAVGANDEVHVTWSEVIPGSGGFSKPDEQYINYRNLSLPTSERISGGAAIQINSNRPTLSMSASSISGDTLCVVWHGFYTGTKEEVLMRCSLDSGSTWNPLVNVSDSPELLSIFSNVKVDGAGRAHVSWVELELVNNTYIPDLYYRAGSSQASAVFLPLVLRMW